MKKANFTVIGAVILTVALTFACILPSFAAKSVTLKLDIAGENGKVYVRLTAPADSDISTVSAALKYDSNKLEFSSVSYIKDETIISATNENKDASEVTANIVIADSLTQESKIFTYIFNVKDGAEGEVTFDFTKIEATDSSDNFLNIRFDREATAVLSELAPLTPDITQSDFNKPSESEPVSEEPSSEETETVTSANASTPAIPPTMGRIITVSAVAVALVAGIAAVFIIISNKKKQNV